MARSIPGTRCSSPSSNRSTTSLKPETTEKASVADSKIGFEVVAGGAAARSARASKPATLLDDVASAAERAAASVGVGRGPVYGTRVHTAFADELAALGRSDVFSEVSYLNGRVVPYGTPGSVRLDVVVGSPTAPTAIYDLKTGSASLTSSRMEAIRAHLPAGFQDVPVLEVRP